MKKNEILVAIYKYLDLQYDLKKNRTNEYIYYISNINPFIWNDKSAADPAYYEDFTTIYNKYFKVDKCSIKEGYDFAIKYLKEYNEVEMKRYGSNIEEVINVFSQCSFKEWKKITNNKEC